MDIQYNDNKYTQLKEGYSQTPCPCALYEFIAIFFNQCKLINFSYFPISTYEI